jgi:hypothetical protein
LRPGRRQLLAAHAAATGRLIGPPS